MLSSLNLAALVSLIPAALLPFRTQNQRDSWFWAVLALAVLGPLLWSVSLFSENWSAGLAADLWAGIAASMILFTGVCLLERQAWRLMPLLSPYLLLLGLAASLLAGTAELPLPDNAPGAWLDLHILVSVGVIATLTLAAVAALGSFLQSRALKLKKPNRLTRLLPAVADSERLSERLLAVSELILGLGLATGMATQYLESGNFLKLDHKTLLSLLAFAVIGLLLIGRRVCGVRGQMAARVVLLAYLLIILGYFGVKFVHQVLLS